jgi:hypothetical protein
VTHELQMVGAGACWFFAGWQVGEMLKPVLRRLGLYRARVPVEQRILESAARCQIDSALALQTALRGGDVLMQPSAECQRCGAAAETEACKADHCRPRRLPAPPILLLDQSDLRKIWL